MKSTLKLITFLFSILIMSCSGGEEQKEEKKTVKLKDTKTEKPIEKKNENLLASATVDLTNKGIGPIKSLKIDDAIDNAMVEHGKEVFTKLCTACHREGKKFIGPPPNGILERRTPEWIMNMILDPEGMVKNDPLAKALLVEFNGSPMANQNLTEEEARAVLEYFRTLK